MARVPYRDPEELPEEHHDLLYAPYADREPVNVFRAIGNNPAVLDSFRKYFGVLWTQSGLSERERQLVILTAARRTEAAYMWHQHVRIARLVGIEDDEIRAVSRGEYGALEGREPAVLRYAAAAVDDTVDDALHDRLAAVADASTAVGIVLLATGYAGLAKALSALDVGLEDGFVGWDLAG